MSANNQEIDAKYTPLFEGVELSSEAKEKAVSILAEAEKVQAEKLVEQFEAKEKELEAEFDKNITEAYGAMVEKVDGFLDTVVESWAKENEIAIEQGIRTQIAENFLSSMKEVFEESYVEVPAEKVDLVEELETKANELESQYDSQLKENLELKKELNGIKCESVVNSLSEDLTVVDKEKFKKLVEDVDIDDTEAFETKASELKESFFAEEKKEVEEKEDVLAEEVKDDKKVEDKKEEVLEEDVKEKPKSLADLIPSF